MTATFAVACHQRSAKWFDDVAFQIGAEAAATVSAFGLRYFDGDAETAAEWVSDGTGTLCPVAKNDANLVRADKIAKARNSPLDLSDLAKP